MCDPVERLEPAHRRPTRGSFRSRAPGARRPSAGATVGGAASVLLALFGRVETGAAQPPTSTPAAPPQASLVGRVDAPAAPTVEPLGVIDLMEVLRPPHPPSPGQVRDGTSRTRGYCKVNEIRRPVRTNAGRFRACYRWRLRTTPTLRGTIHFRWTVALDGRVTRAKAVRDTVGDRDLKQCLLRTIRRLRFPPPQGGVCVVDWPFLFDPE